MDGYVLFWILVIIILTVGVAAGLIAEAIRNKDFQDQISGKKPERKLDSDETVTYDKPGAPDPMLEAGKEVFRTRKASNMTWPK